MTETRWKLKNTQVEIRWALWSLINLTWCLYQKQKRVKREVFSLEAALTWFPQKPLQPDSRKVIYVMFPIVKMSHNMNIVNFLFGVLFCCEAHYMKQCLGCSLKAVEKCERWNCNKSLMGPEGETGSPQQSMSQTTINWTYSDSSFSRFIAPTVSFVLITLSNKRQDIFLERTEISYTVISFFFKCINYIYVYIYIYINYGKNPKI